MTRTTSLFCAIIYLSFLSPSFAAESQSAKSASDHIRQRESLANSVPVPNPILSTGCDITSNLLSPNAMALADQLQISEQLYSLGVVKSMEVGSLTDRLDYFEAREHIGEVLRGAEMDVDYVLAEISDEQATYNELLTSFSSERDSTIFKTNAVSFGANGALWALCEALAIPTASHPNYAISSGITGIFAGIIPSIASALTLKQINGKKHSAPAAPNMLSKMFGRPTSQELEYPTSVWTFLTSAPADKPRKLRKDIIIDRWVMDSNIPVLTDRASASQINAVTASTEQKKNLTISLLTARIAMLQQLATEVSKMNRLLDELEMALRGLKHAETAVASSGHGSAQ